MVEPPRWTDWELAEEVRASTEIFRKERLSEPLGMWADEVRTRVAEFRRLFSRNGIVDPGALTPQDVIEITDEGLLDALRYLAGPPVSADDLKTLADVNSLTKSALSADDAAGAAAIAEIFRATVDPERFPWITQRRKPSAAEIEAAVAASAALLAGQRLQTMRRNTSKTTQEEAVKEFLRSIGFVEAATPKRIDTLEDAPPRGHFCGETLVGTRKADVPVRLYDGRLMPLECKVSYSALNSIKRINNDAQVKAAIWLREFGERQVVPAAMLSGVFGVTNLLRAQHGALTLFWSHRLDAMRDFIEATKT